MSETDDRLYLSVLVVRLQAGDEAAFGEIVGRYAPRLRYYLAKALGGRGGRGVDVEDVLQEVWFDVFRAAPRLADPAAFPAWIYRIARDRAFRHLRRRPPPTETIEAAALASGDADDKFTAE